MRATIGTLALSALLLAVPALAQHAEPGSPPPAPGTASDSSPAAATPAPPAAVDQNAPAARVPATARPDLAVATVRLTQGWRASKLIGADVFNDQNQKIGSIDDLIVMPDKQISYAIISVGGFLGMGSKLVAIPYDHLHMQATKNNGQHIELAGASKATLQSMPSFTFGNG